MNQCLVLKKKYTYSKYTLKRVLVMEIIYFKRIYLCVN